jgi:hypothetical protein
LTLFFLAVISVVAPATPQEPGGLQGSVVDEQGGLVVGAQVLLNDGRTHRYTATTDKEGRYQFLAVPAGRYTLIVSATGFDESSQKVELVASRTITLDLTLRINLKEKVEVQASRDNLNAVTIDREKVEALPQDPRLLRRRILQLARAAGAGAPSIYVDGFPQAGRLPRKESIQSIRVSAEAFAAEFAEPGQERVEITTKPATDNLHGEINFNFNDQRLNARDPFALTRAPVQLRDYSAAFSGPIKSNRWGYFVDLSRTEEKGNAVVNATILNSTTLLPQPFITTVITPSRETDISFRTNYLFGARHQLDLRYGNSKSTEQNQGLEDAFDLPERAVDSGSRDDLIRLSLTSIFSEHTVNQAWLELSRSHSTDAAVNTQPAVSVLDSFTAGGNQDELFSNTLSRNLQFADDVTYARNRHTFKAGVLAVIGNLQDTDRSNFGGTFIFGTDFERNERGLPVPGQVLITPLESYRRTLLKLPGYRPLQFTINSGDPFIGLTQWQGSLFAQDEWRISERLNFSYGLRAESQTHLRKPLSVAPRAALAARPFRNGKSILRLGAGIFYSRIAPGITVDTERFDGVREQELVVQRPAFFLSIPTVINRATSLTTLRTKSRDLTAPYSFLSTISFQQKLPAKLAIIVSYTWERGLHLLRTRNINAPLPGSTDRPLPTIGPILQYESSGISKRHEFVVTLHGDLSDKISFSGSYQLGFTRNDTDSATMAPANSYDLTSEFGRAESDQRHQFDFDADFQLPWHIRVSPDLHVGSSAPFNITTGSDDNGDTLFTDRPAFAKAGDAGAVVTRFGIFNPHPQPGDVIIPRNFGRGPDEVSVNLSLSRTFSFGAVAKEATAGAPVGSKDRNDGRAFWPQLKSGISDRNYRLTFSIEASNLLNHTNFGAFNGVITSPLFGQPNSADDPRRINLGVRFSF